jgi:hypothetical protein
MMDLLQGSRYAEDSGLRRARCPKIGQGRGFPSHAVCSIAAPA